LDTDLLSQSANKFQAYLINNGYQNKIIEMPDTTRTASEAAASIGCTIAQIVKSIIFQTKENHLPVMVTASGVNRVDELLVSNIIGDKIKKADADFVHSVTGYAIGGVPPAGHNHQIITLIDEDLLSFDEIWAAGGSPHAVFKLTPAELVGLTQGKVVKVKQT
jgi:prolyl-tRNA editing enzyme YbaK/EbsC (Cys-tRNA(Pro) deacylase)